MEWKPNTFRLFISHLSSNHLFAQDLASSLENCFGVSGFVAHEDIEPSAEWQKEIEEALDSMDGLLALLTDRFSQNAWCNQEVGWALGSNKICVSVRDGEDPPGFAGRFQAVRIGDRNTVRIAREIFSLLAGHKKTAEQIAVSTSLNLLHAPSWEHINHVCVPCLNALTAFPEEALDNVERAFADNHRVAEAFKANEIRRFLNRHGR